MHALTACLLPCSARGWYLYGTHFGMLENGNLNVIIHYYFFPALWVTHFTVDEKLRQVVIFENWKCSERTGKKCVLYTHQVGADYTLTGKKIDKIPKILEEIEPKIGFFKHPKATGSELLYFKSMLTTKERPLMVGFDGVGQPIPMNRVIKYSSDFQAFFKILEAG